MSQFITETLKYRNSVADPDVYIRASKKTNGEEYYEMLLVYVDDILCVSHDPKSTMDAISNVFELRDSVGAPDRYLGANLKLRELEDGRKAWSMDGKEYINNAVRLVQEMLVGDGRTLSRKGKHRPYPEKYRPEMDVSPELDAQMSGRFQLLYPAGSV